MDLENIVANSVYMRARNAPSASKYGRSKNWRKMLSFPLQSETTSLQAYMDEQRMLKFHGLLEQPIFVELFRLFCTSNRDWNETLACFRKVHQFNALSNNIERIDALTRMCEELTTTPEQLSRPWACHFLEIKESLDCNRFTGSTKDALRPVRDLCYRLLEKEPFESFQRHPLFQRFIQWKVGLFLLDMHMCVCVCLCLCVCVCWRWCRWTF
jgi:hypothetical protein